MYEQESDRTCSGKLKIVGNVKRLFVQVELYGGRLTVVPVYLESESQLGLEVGLRMEQSTWKTGNHKIVHIPFHDNSFQCFMRRPQPMWLWREWGLELS